MSIVNEVKNRLSLTTIPDDAPCRQLVRKVASWGPNVFGQGWLIDNDVILDVKCLAMTPDTVYFNILTIDEERGKGKASVVLDRFLSAADELGVKVIAYPKPFGAQKGLNKTQLKSWYKRHGFVPRGSDSTIHEPPQAEE